MSYFEDGKPGRRKVMHRLTCDEARRIVINIAKLPEVGVSPRLLGKSHSISEGHCRPQLIPVLVSCTIRWVAGTPNRAESTMRWCQRHPHHRSIQTRCSMQTRCSILYRCSIRTAARSVASRVRAGGYVAERRGHFFDADNAGIGELRVVYLAACTQRLLY